MLHADRNANGIIINMLQVKCRLGAISHVIALDAGVVRAIQYDDRRRQRGINSEVECLRHRITRIVSRFHIQRIVAIRHGARPGIIPDARRRALCRLNPGHATVNAQTDFVNVPRYRHAELRMGVVSHIVAGNTVIINQFNSINGDLGINSDRQRR
ncbi:hypothetical protein NGUA15_01838 [Salmonella enterica]|nr:hypothetical protein NGUA15_01838 [Salmonella enterica]